MAPRLNFRKPALIHSKFFASLQGPKGKMSASDTNSAIFLTDTKAQISEKVNRAFSGGQDTAELHRKLGANLEIDVPFQYLSFFLEDDEELAEIGSKYSKGEMLTGQVKKRLINLLWTLIQRHQEAREAVTDTMIDAFLSVRRMSPFFD